MPDAPRLPDSPLKAFQDQCGDPRVAVWRKRMLTASIGLLGAFSAGAFAFFMFVGWPSSTSDLIEFVGAFIIGASNLLLGLVALQVGLGYPPDARWAAAIGSLLAVACAAGHAWFLEEVGDQETTALAYGIAGLVGDAAVAVLPALRRTRIARPATAGTIMACVLAPLALLWEVADELSILTGIWATLAIAAVLLVPIAGAAVLLWLLFTEPEG